MGHVLLTFNHCSGRFDGTAGVFNCTTSLRESRIFCWFWNRAIPCLSESFVIQHHCALRHCFDVVLIVQVLLLHVDVVWCTRLPRTTRSGHSSRFRFVGVTSTVQLFSTFTIVEMRLDFNEIWEQLLFHYSQKNTFLLWFFDGSWPQSLATTHFTTKSVARSGD